MAVVYHHNNIGMMGKEKEGEEGQTRGTKELRFLRPRMGRQECPQSTAL